MSKCYFVFSSFYFLFWYFVFLYVKMPLCQVRSRISKRYFFFFFFFTLFAFRFSTFGLRLKINLSRCRIASSERQNSEPEYIKSWMSKCYFDFRFSKCYFDIRAEPEYLASNLKVLFFVFRFSTFGLRLNMKSWMSECYSDIQADAEYIKFLMSKSYFDNPAKPEYNNVSNVEMLFYFSIFVFWHSDWGRPILFWHWSRCRISSSEFWHSSRARIYRLECQNAILFFVFHFSFFTFLFSTFGLRPNIKSLMLKWISSSEWQKHILTFQQNKKMYEKLLEKYRECQSHKPQPTPDTKRKRKRTKTNTCKTNKQTNCTRSK